MTDERPGRPARQSNGRAPADRPGGEPDRPAGRRERRSRTEPTPAQETPRAQRVTDRTRPAQWRRPPLRIEESECISCDACVEACPSQFGAVFNLGHGMAILPELCSGCGKCLPPVCPADCIYPDETWQPAREEWWEEPFGPEDPYILPDGTRRPPVQPTRIRRW
ncbi:indolepyruvate ferredoxin oxidoreductase subunit alpha [Streptomyces sp. NPDC004629]|uniref:indolepyruvate ferredoxin oxidoreductase subunit alpha n=1 Tax=Streptomyces sp. NPDC004629 TaxID=3364705 RepID=UPI00369A83DF